jgi:hypothetical protein
MDFSFLISEFSYKKISKQWKGLAGEEKILSV